MSEYTYKYKIGQVFKLKKPTNDKSKTYRATVIAYNDGGYLLRWREPGAPDEINTWSETGINWLMLSMVEEAPPIQLDEDLFTL